MRTRVSIFSLLAYLVKNPIGKRKTDVSWRERKGRILFHWVILRLFGARTRKKLSHVADQWAPPDDHKFCFWSRSGFLRTASTPNACDKFIRVGE
jgi:hypothetical protein